MKLPTVHTNKIFRIIDEESSDFRTTPVREWPRMKSAARDYDRLKAPERYTRVLDDPDESLFYEISTKFSDQTLIQIDVRHSGTESEVTPLGIVMGAVIQPLTDQNILFIEQEMRSVISERRKRFFIPLVRDQKESRAWENYVVWASDPRNWSPQIHALNYSPEVRDAGSRITLSAPMGESSFVLQCAYGGQVLRKAGKTVSLCRFVPTCAEGIMSKNWYFGLREAIYFLMVVRKVLSENAPPRVHAAYKNIIRYNEPVIDRLVVI